MKLIRVTDRMETAPTAALEASQSYATIKPDETLAWSELPRFPKHKEGSPRTFKLIGDVRWYLCVDIPFEAAASLSHGLEEKMQKFSYIYTLLSWTLFGSMTNSLHVWGIWAHFAVL